MAGLKVNGCEKINEMNMNANTGKSKENGKVLVSIRVT